jgi:hypothetical protein
VTTALPATRRLDGAAMRLALAPETPVLLSARTTGPVIAGLVRGGVAEAPDLFPAGAAFHRYLPAGASELALLSPNDGPLSGTLELTAEPVTTLTDGIGAPVVVAPGGSALFGFTVTRKGPVGAGIRAEPDQVAVRLLDAEGRSLGTGVAQLHDLAPGRYLLEARVPPDGTTTTLRPAVLGLTPPPAGPRSRSCRSPIPTSTTCRPGRGRTTPSSSSRTCPSTAGSATTAPRGRLRSPRRRIRRSSSSRSSAG